MKLNPKQLAVSAALLSLLAAGAALPAAAASPISATAAISIDWPWSAVATESVETGDYAAAMTVGTAQQLSPVVLPEKAAKRNAVSYVSDNPNVVSVSEDGVAQAVGLGTAQITATSGNVSCTYVITTQPDSSMVATEMDITLASNTIAVGDTTSLSLAVLPTSAANYIDVTLSSSDPGVATVNNFGKVTGVAPGKATITATSGDVSCSATITVVAAASSTTGATQSISLNTNYVVLKPGSSKTITGTVSPSSSSQALTFTSQDKSIATVSANGVITGVSTGATAVIVSNGTVSSSVTVIVNRTASASGDDTNNSGDGDTTETDPIAAAIENAASDTISYPQSQVPVVTSEMLNVLRKTGRTLVLNANDYVMTIDGTTIRNTNGEVYTTLNFTEDEYGLRFSLNDGEALPCGVKITMTGENASYGRLYLHNTVTEKWQFLNSYKDGEASVDVAGEYLLTNQNLRFTSINWTFFIGAGILVVVCLIAYIAVKKRYWFW